MRAQISSVSMFGRIVAGSAVKQNFEVQPLDTSLVFNCVEKSRM